MAQEFLTIQEASEISTKSIQTIRRAVKAKKLKFKRKRTPQGFNYLVEKDSLLKTYKISKAKAVTPAPEKIQKIETKKTIKIEVGKKDKSDKFITSGDFQTLTKALEKLMNQHSEERQSFLGLVNNLNEKIFSMENQLKLLQAPKKHWFSFWKKV